MTPALLLIAATGTLVLLKARGMMTRYTDVLIVPAVFLAAALIGFVLGNGGWLLLAVFAGACVWAVWFAHRAPDPRPDLASPAPPGVTAPEGWRTHTLAALHMLVFKTVPLKDLEEPLHPEVRKHSNIVYGDAGNRPLHLHVYEPKSRDGSAMPAILFVHGGGWNSGDLNQLNIYANHFARAGYVTICMEYRLSGEAPFPHALEDVLTAIRWARANADQYGIDPARLALSGNSAGGHLAMMAAYGANDPQWNRESGHAGHDESVKALVNIYGGYDLTADWVRREPNIRAFLNARPDEVETYRRASPRFYVSAASPPTLILHGDLDLHSPIGQSDALAEDLFRFGVPCTYGRLAGWAHIFDVSEQGFEWAVGYMEPFLKEHLR